MNDHDRDAPAPTLVGIVGDSGSGKTTVAHAVRQLLGPERVTELQLDDYHRYTRKERQEKGITALHPDAHDFALMREHLQLLRQGRPVRVRTYDHTNGTFGPLRTVEPKEFVIVRGLLGFPNDELRQAYDLAVFLFPEPELLYRWKLRRDVRSRGYTEADVLKFIAQHLLDAKVYVHPQAERADVVVHYRLPHPDAPDEAVETIVEARGAVAEAVRQWAMALPGLAPETDDGTARVRVPADFPAAPVQAWLRDAFGGCFDPTVVGAYQGETADGWRPPLALVEGLVAWLARQRAWAA